MKLSVVLAVYNEAGNIGPLIRNIRKVIEKTDELIVVDDASTDTTVQEIDPNLATVLRHRVNRGKGSAVRTAIHAASGDCILLMDGDGQDDPQDILKVVGPIKQNRADFVIGSRFLSSDQNPFVTPVNEIGNKFLTSLVNFLFKMCLTDSQSAFKCFKADALKSLDLQSDRYEIETEMLIKAIKKKLKILEVPVNRFERVHGKSHLYQIPFGRLKFGLRASKTLFKGYFIWR